MSTIVVRTADRVGVEPMELEPLATTIDPDLVISFATSDATGRDSRLQFRYSGCDVRVTGSGEVSVVRGAASTDEE